MSNSQQKILFEPWNMGDALIAAATALQEPARLTLACNSRWHTVIRAAAEGLEAPALLAVDLEYVNRSRGGRLDLGTLPQYPQAEDILTIRGDIRDTMAARKIFPQGTVHSSGWLAFVVRRSRLLDTPFAKGWLPVRNRYRAWASMAGVPWEKVEGFYSLKLPSPAQKLVTIHIGAQWRSKQYPHVAALAETLSRTVPVQIVGGPGDPLPEGVAETEVRRLINQELVDAFRSSSAVVANDSGPMHLAAILRCRTYALCRTSSVAEWVPPAAVAIEAAGTPKGYSPHPDYMSDKVTGGWATPEEIAGRVLRDL